MVTALTRPDGSSGSSPQGLGKIAKIPYKHVDVRLVMLHRDQPLLDLPPGRQEDAAVVLEEPVRMAVGVLDAEEAAEVAHGLGGKDDAALRADRDDLGVEPGTADLAGESAGRSAAQGVYPLIGLRGGHLKEHGAAGGHRQGVSVKRPYHFVSAVGHVRHDLRGSADGGDG